MLWQSAHSEFYFCDALWPDFRRIDFLRALRSYALRQRRHGRTLTADDTARAMTSSVTRALACRSLVVTRVAAYGRP